MKMKMIIAFILGMIISGGIVFAAEQIYASEVSYDNTSSGLKDNSNHDVEDAQTVLDIINNRMNTSIDVDKYGVKYTTTKNALFTTGFVCFIRNNNRYCIGHEYSYGRGIIKQAFSDVTCSDDGFSALCSADDMTCFIQKNGRFGCADRSVASHCEVDAGGPVTC